jgi:Xaa-Pro aminopeptidase
MQDTLPTLEVPKSFGYGMGIFLSENNLAINESNDRVIQAGFSFLVSCNLYEIKYLFYYLRYESKKQGSKTFAVHISDNVIVAEKGQEVLTN